MQLRELYTTGKNLLAMAMVPEPAIEASSLLANAAGLDKTSIYTRPEMTIDENAVLKFNEFISRRINGEPNSYITGIKEFYSKEFIVNNDVLIPRPETELIVEEALKIIPDSSGYVVADICAGSGCIGITLASIKKNIKLISADIELPAALVANKNAKINSVDTSSLFLNTDLLDCIKDGSLEMVVCNPPYVAAGDYYGLQDEVRNHEPRQALVSGEDGLDHIKEIVYQSKKKLKNGGWLIIEIGDGQSAQAVELFKRCGYGQIDVVLDINKIERVIKGQWKES